MSVDYHSNPNVSSLIYGQLMPLLCAKVSFCLVEDTFRFLNIRGNFKSKLKEMAIGKLVHLILLTSPLLVSAFLWNTHIDNIYLVLALPYLKRHLLT